MCLKIICEKIPTCFYVCMNGSLDFLLCPKEIDAYLGRNLDVA